MTFGSVDLRPSGMWRARVSVDGKRISLGTHATEEAALTAIHAWQALHAEGVIASVDSTLLWHGPRYLDRREKTIRGIRTERSRWKVHLSTAPWAKLPMRQITRADVRDWTRTVTRKASRETAQRCLSLLRGMLEDAFDRQLVDSNVAATVKLPRKVETTDTWMYLEPDGQRQALLCQAIPPEDRTIIAIAMWTGVRQGELCRLELVDVELELDPHVVVRRTKSGKNRRVPLMPNAVRAMAGWIAQLPAYAPENPHKLVFPLPRGGRRQPGHPLGQTYQRSDGKRKRVDKWKVHLEAAGLPRKLRWHDLRHTCASSLIAGWWGRRWTLPEVCAFLGHSSITVTQRYAHLGDTELKKASRGTRSIGPASLLGGGRKRGNAMKQGVGQPGLEPGTDGLKGLGPTKQKQAPKPSRDQAGTMSFLELAEAVIVAQAKASPAAHRLALELATRVRAAELANTCTLKDGEA